LIAWRPGRRPLFPIARALSLSLSAHLEREQEADRLERLLPAVDVVPQEEVVGLGREAAVLEQAQEVRVLAVDVA